MTETNAERIERMKLNGLVGTQEIRNGLMESVDGLRDGDFKWLIGQTERLPELELLLRGNDGMSVKEIRQQFVDLHRSVLILEDENNRMHRVIGKAVAQFRQDEHREGMSTLESELEVWK